MTENTDTLSPEVLADLKAKAMKATPGPWFADTRFGCEISGNEDGDADDHGRLVVTVDHVCSTEDSKRPEDDRAYIIAAQPARVLSLLTALEEAQSGLHGVMEAGRQEIALLRARAEKAEQQAAALMNAINKTIPLLEDEGVGWIARPLIAARDKPLADVLGAALSPNKSEADSNA